ncbi:hypothetical protein [Flagellimonas nanhaiensis]|uniref:Uncharacterized protein n=1 Tax=Flagellimonas nanhaiensis TaxID=2292706 RepID=A0A371JQ05_9FLAO|nr:hypothetical protein [Allomuricauda nanhaiensis]RDY59598.1 hypothetical protein DX873_09490 [Allomuricauda nanhaiensis]
MLTSGQIAQLNLWIEDTYGSPERLIQRLNELIYMLHYLEEEVFTQHEIQGAVETLKGLGRVLNWCGTEL